MYYSNVLGTIGNTPIVKLKRYSPKKSVRIFAKLEGTNPSGSIKDRIAYFMIKEARKRGLIKSDTKIIEATSGNTGIALSLVCAIYGYSFTAVMPKNVSKERRKLIRTYGGEIILTKQANGTDYAYQFAAKYVKEKSNYLMLDQFSNKVNVEAHYLTTGEEIIRDIPGITHFVSGIGTGGTLMGIGKRLKRYNEKIKIIGITPKPFSQIQGLRSMEVFVPPIFDSTLIDQQLKIDNEESAIELVRDLFKNNGLSVGISSGAALWGAMEIAKTINKGVIVTIFPDRGDRYYSTALFQ